MLAEKELRRHKAQDGIAQELQPLVAENAAAPVLVDIGTVAQGLVQQLPVPEAVG